MNDVVLRKTVAGICTITLNRPSSLNAMNRALIDATAEAFRTANADDEVAVIIFTGAGSAFCAGDDLHEHNETQSKAEAGDLVEAIQIVSREILFGSKPVIGAINGWAVGGGFEWAINCDFSIWSENARAFFPEVSWGLFVTGGVTALLPKLVGMSMAKEMLLLGERYDSTALLQAGLAWQVVPEERLLESAQQLAKRLVVLPRRAVADMKNVLNRVAYGGTDSIEQAMQLETEATIRGFTDPKTSERIQSFSKR
jgi:enoyl-CoA hydratase/carnithine racemase